MAHNRHELAVDVYNKIMAWLESSPLPSGSAVRLDLPIKAGDETKTLRFQKHIGMGATMWALSCDNPAIKIDYDPNWSAISKIESLIG